MEIVFKENEKFNIPEESIYKWIMDTTEGRYTYLDPVNGYYGIFGVNLHQIKIMDLYTYFANYKLNAQIGLLFLKDVLKKYKVETAINLWKNKKL